MRWRELLWLFVLAAGIALWVQVLEESAPVPPAAAPPADTARADRLLAWPPARLSALTLAFDGPELRLERGAQGWQYAQAASGDAAAARYIAEHLEMFAAARIERSLAAAPHTLAQYGIGESGARVRLYLDGRDEPAGSLRIGTRTPDGFGQYVLLEGTGQVVVVPAYQIDNLRALARGPQRATP